MSRPKLPLPDEFSEKYWAGAREGVLLIQRCTACGRHQFYPRQHCAACLADAPEWVACDGVGTLHTYSIVHRTPNEEFVDQVPYVLALVDLDEGVRITTNVIDSDHERLRCGDRVRVVFRSVTDDVVLPCVTVETSNGTTE